MIKKGEKIYMDYTEDEVLEILKDDSRIDEFLSSLTGDDLKKYLRINKIVLYFHQQKFKKKI